MLVAGLLCVPACERYFRSRWAPHQGALAPREGLRWFAEDP